MECPAAESPSRAIPRRVENRITWRWAPCDTGFESRLQEIGQSGHRPFRHLRRNFRNGPCRVRVRWRHIIRLPSAKALAARPGRECGERGADGGSGWPDGWPVARPFPWRLVESGRMPCGNLRRHPGGESGLTAGARFQTARVPDRAGWPRLTAGRMGTPGVPSASRQPAAGRGPDSPSGAKAGGRHRRPNPKKSFSVPPREIGC